MLKALLIALFVALGIATPVKPLVVGGVDPGGNIGTYMDWWKRVSATGASVVIDGACISACTLVLGNVPEDRICMTERASFGFHMVSIDGEPNEFMTVLYTRTLYPPWVQAWIKAHGPLKEEPIFATQEDFKDHIRKCDPTDLGPVGVAA